MPLSNLYLTPPNLFLRESEKDSLPSLHVWQNKIIIFILYWGKSVLNMRLVPSIKEGHAKLLILVHYICSMTFVVHSREARTGSIRMHAKDAQNLHDSRWHSTKHHETDHGDLRTFRLFMYLLSDFAKLLLINNGDTAIINCRHLDNIPKLDARL